VVVVVVVVILCSVGGGLVSGCGGCGLQPQFRLHQITSDPHMPGSPPGQRRAPRTPSGRTSGSRAWRSALVIGQGPPVCWYLVCSVGAGANWQPENLSASSTAIVTQPTPHPPHHHPTHQRGRSATPLWESLQTSRSKTWSVVERMMTLRTGDA